MLPKSVWNLWLVVPIVVGLNPRLGEVSSKQDLPSSTIPSYLILRESHVSYPEGSLPDRTLLLAARDDPGTACELSDTPNDPADPPSDAPTSCDSDSGCTTSGSYLIPTLVPTLIPTAVFKKKRDVKPRTGAIFERIRGGPGDGSHPLLDPANFRGSGLVKRLWTEAGIAEGLKKKNPDAVGGLVGIFPRKGQEDIWTVTAPINGEDVKIPVGLTAEFYSFGAERGVWRVEELEGCTVTVVVSQEGFWVLHIWEGSKTVNGGGAFLRRTATTTNGGDKDDTKNVTPRSKEEFAACAVNLLDQTSPDDVADLGGWISLKDIRDDLDFGDPFGNPTDVQVFTLTRAKSGSDPSQKYSDRIAELKEGITSAIPGFDAAQNYRDATYVGAGDSPKPAEGIAGTLHFQYSPWHGMSEDETCPKKMAGFRVYVEDRVPAVLEKYWIATEYQIPKLKRDLACAISSETSSSTITSSATITTLATITSPPASIPSCDYVAADPGHAKVAECVCNSSKTLPLLTPTASGTHTIFANSERCAYTTLPSTGVSIDNPVTSAPLVWTTNCQACTMTGGVADGDICTPVKGCSPTGVPAATTTAPASSNPAIVAWVANLTTVNIGNADDGNSTAFGQDMFTKLMASCTKNQCKDSAVMDGVEVIIAGGEDPLTPELYFQEAQYNSTMVLQQMLAVGLSTWISAINNPSLNLCTEVEYEAEADETGSGCGSGPIEPNKIRRAVRTHDNKVLWARDGVEERCEASCGTGGLICHYKARMCLAPSEITVVSGTLSNPYENHLNIGVRIAAIDGEAGFLCEEIVEELTAATAILAPELLPGEITLEGIELGSICGIINNITEAFNSITSLLPAPTGK